MKRHVAAIVGLLLLAGCCAHSVQAPPVLIGTAEIPGTGPIGKNMEGQACKPWTPGCQWYDGCNTCFCSPLSAEGGVGGGCGCTLVACLPAVPK